MILPRRQFIAGLGGATISAVASSSRALERRPSRIGFVGGGEPADSATFLADLSAGLVNLKDARLNVSIEERYANRDLDRVQRLVDELEGQSVELIVTHASAVLPVVRARRKTPVVYILSADPVSVGLTTTLSKPEYNATGLTLMAAELNGKRLELLREVSPGSRRLCVVYNPLHGGEHLERAWIDDRARSLNFDVNYFPASNSAALAQALIAAEKSQPDAMLLLSDGFLQQERKPVLGLASKLRIPVFAGWAVFAESGALCSYGPRIPEMVQRTAIYVDLILRGATTTELPIERPNTFELVMNLDAAAQIGLSLSPSLIARADRVIG